MNTEEFYEEYWAHREDVDHMYEDWIPPRAKIARKIIETGDFPTILDVGCGQGVLGELLRQGSGHPGLLCGCDISSKAIEYAKPHYDELQVIDIESESLDQFSESKFDCITCLETLEHLFDPGAALEQINSLLENEGLFIASFPNFVHYIHRLDILRGGAPKEYTLTHEGAEHIQNFTIESFKELLSDNGFSILEVHPIYDLPNKLPYFIGKYFPNAYATQYVVEAEVSE